MLEFLFWISLSLIIYTYLGYPCYLYLLHIFTPKRMVFNHVPGFPVVSVIIAACNEEKNILSRLENILGQDYPADCLDIIVVSDGSTDQTNNIVSAFIDSRIRLCALPERGGKSLAVNRGVAEAKGEIIVFTDARQAFLENAISQLVKNFADPQVGCASGELLFWSDPNSLIEAEMGAYWKYEKFIRRCESASGSVVGATGCIYAIRRELFQPIPAGTILDDVLIPMNIARLGRRVSFDSKSVAYDIISKDVNQEWRRKVRTLAGNWQLLSLAPWILIPFCNPLWMRYISHKLLRLLIPFAMVNLLVISFFLSGFFYQLITLLQIVFYAIALTGFLMPSSKNNRLVNLIYFFMVMNVAVLAGFCKWISGGCATAWQPAYSGVEKPLG